MSILFSLFNAGVSLTTIVYSYIWYILNKERLPTDGQVGWGCRIHQLELYTGVNSPNNSPGYDTKQSDSEASVMLELWGMQITSSLLSLSVSLWSEVVEPDRVLSIGEIELNCVLMLN